MKNIKDNFANYTLSPGVYNPIEGSKHKSDGRIYNSFSKIENPSFVKFFSGRTHQKKVLTKRLLLLSCLLLNLPEESQADSFGLVSNNMHLNVESVNKIDSDGKTFSEDNLDETAKPSENIYELSSLPLRIRKKYKEPYLFTVKDWGNQFKKVYQ